MFLMLNSFFGEFQNPLRKNMEERFPLSILIARETRRYMVNDPVYTHILSYTVCTHILYIDHCMLIIDTLLGVNFVCLQVNRMMQAQTVIDVPRQQDDNRVL